MTEALQTPPPLTDYPILTDDNDKPWSHKGRFGRLSLFAWAFLVGIAFDVIFVPLILISGGISAITTHNFSGSSFAVLGVLYSAVMYFIVIFNIRRTHDLDKSGWWNLLLLIPLINFIFILYLFVAKGTDGPNRFGPQRVTPQWEKVVGWIYIVFTIGTVALMISVISTFVGIARNAANHPAPQIQPTNSITATDTSTSAPTATTSGS